MTIWGIRVEAKAHTATGADGSEAESFIGCHSGGLTKQTAAKRAKRKRGRRRRCLRSFEAASGLIATFSFSTKTRGEICQTLAGDVTEKKKNTEGGGIQQKS